ncbi:MAG: hypothetical protein ACYC8T_13125 [Myxococcaceae bacterium]
MTTGKVTDVLLGTTDRSNNVQSVLLVKALGGYAVFVAHAGGVTHFLVDDQGNATSADTLLDFATPVPGSLLRIAALAVAD